jgi:hypothetical protein
VNYVESHVRFTPGKLSDIFRPIQRWNPGKVEEFRLRKTYKQLDGEFEKLNKGLRQETLKDNSLEKSR